MSMQKAIAEEDDQDLDDANGKANINLVKSEYVDTPEDYSNNYPLP